MKHKEQLWLSLLLVGTFMPSYLVGQGKSLILEEVTPFDGVFAKVIYHHKKQLLHRSGNIMLDDVVQYTSEGFVIGTKDGLYGVLDSTGKVIIPFDCDEIRKDYQANAFVIQRNGGYSLADSLGNVLTKKSYEDVASLSPTTTAVKEKGLWGWIANETGEQLVQAQFDRVSYLKENGKLINVEKNELNGLVAEGGQLVVEPIYKFLYVIFSQQHVPLFRFADNHGDGLINAEGKILTGRYYSKVDVPALADEPLLLPVMDEQQKQGIIDAKGKEVVEPKYDRIHRFIQGIAVVELHGKFGLVDIQGKEIIPPTYNKIGYVYQQQNDGSRSGLGNYDYPITIEAPSLKPDAATKQEKEDRLMSVIAENESGIQLFKPNGHKEMVTDQFYQSIITIDSKTYLVVTKDNKQGIIDLRGRSLVPTMFDEVRFGTGDSFLDKDYFSPLGTDELPQNYVKVNLANKLGLYHISGKELTGPTWDEIRWVNHNLISVTSDGKEGLLDTTGLIIRKPEQGKLLYAVADDRIIEAYYDKEHHYRSFLTDLQGNIIYQNPNWDYGRSYGFSYPTFRDGLLKITGFVAKNLFVDHQGKEINFTDYDEVGDFFNGWADVVKNDRIGYIDHDGKEMVPAELRFEQRLNDSLLVFSKNGKKGLIKYGSPIPILNFEYDNIEKLYNSKPTLFRVTQGSKKGICDSFGKQILPILYTAIADYGYGFFEIDLNGKKGIAKADGTLLVKPIYDKMEYNRGYNELHSKFPVMVKQGEEWSYIDREGNKLAVLAKKNMMDY